MLDTYGFTKAEVVDSEYGTALDGTPVIGGAAGSAIFNGEVQMYMQDAPVSRVYSYNRIGSSLSPANLAYGAVGALSQTPQRLATTGGDTTGFAVLAGSNNYKRELQVLIADYEISSLLMGPMGLGSHVGWPANTEQVAIPGLGILGTFSWLDRQLSTGFTYTNTSGYDLEIKHISPAWGNLTVKQYRIDNANNMTLVNTWTVAQKGRNTTTVSVTGAPWTPGGATISHGVTYDPAPGVAPGMDLIVVTGSAGQR